MEQSNYAQPIQQAQTESEKRLETQAQTESPIPYVAYRCVTTLPEIEQYRQGASLVAFDFETAPLIQHRTDPRAALDAHRACIVGISLSVTEGSGIYIPLQHFNGGNADAEQVISYLRDHLWMNPAVTKVAHNLAFESMFLYALGIVIQPPCYDTIAAAQLTLKSRCTFRTLSDSGLKTLAAQLLDETLPTFEDVTGGRFFDELSPTAPETIRYACADSDFTLRLYHLFNGWFDKFLPKHRTLVEQVESPTAVYCGLMKYNGLLVDEVAMCHAREQAEAALAHLRQEIAFLIGDVDIGANASTAAIKRYLYNDLQLPVLKTTAKYKEAADDEALLLLTDWCRDNRSELVPLFALILEYRKWGKLLSTYIDGYAKYINPTTGRIHPDLMPLGAESGRFACRKPNLQNQGQATSLPVNVRDFLIAPIDHCIVEADYSQIELRVAAHLSQDPTMLSAYADDADIHAITTAAIFGSSLSEAQDKHRHDYKHRRTVAKSTVFGVLYGIYPKGLKRNLKTAAGIDLGVEACAVFIGNLKHRYAVLAKWQDTTIQQAHARQYAETALGRRRYVPNVASGDFMLRGSAERAALNHGVQGLAADMLKLAMARLLPEIKANPWLAPVLTVHDSLVFYVPLQKEDEARRIIAMCMEAPPFPAFEVPIKAEFAMGLTYGSMTE